MRSLKFTIRTQNNMNVVAGLQRAYAGDLTVSIDAVVKRSLFGSRTQWVATLTPLNSGGEAIVKNIHAQLTR